MPRRLNHFNRGAYGLLLFNLLVVGAIGLLHTSPILANLENAFVDLRYWIRGVQRPDPQVEIVAIDEKSVRELGLYPWPRRTHARLIQLLTDAGARAIAFDVFFTERDPNHPDDDALLGAAAEKSGRTVFAIQV